MPTRYGDGISVREAKWLRCNWPHEIMSHDYERALTALIVAWRPFVAARAEGIAGENEQLKDELEQSGLIQLWCLGLERLQSAAPKLIKRILRRRMIKALMQEICQLADNGERLLPF